jgi:MHS family metabolite:H+ symporter-like MFS transporter
VQALDEPVIGAVNTINNVDGVLTGYNTDYLGAIRALREVTELSHKRIAVIGAGGAARVVVYGCLQEAAEVTVFNRSIERGSALAWSCSLGSALEYYDFALYTLASALIFGSLFFPEQTRAMSLIASFGTYFLGFAIRPLGGVLFGMIGDRVGRKFVLASTVLLMGISSTLMGALPTFHQVGYLAPVLLVVLRLLQGLGAGAEQAGAAVMMTEYAPEGQRGFYAALPFLGIQLGTILPALVYFLVVNGNANVIESGMWRLPFFSSVVIVALGLYMRLSLKESPTFMRLKALKRVCVNPLKSAMEHSKPTLLIGIGLRLAENGGSSIYQALAVSYIVGVVGLQGPVGVLTLICAASLGATTVPIAGKLSDRFGRVVVYRAFALLQLALAFPVWWILSLGNVVASIIAISIALGIGTRGMFGTQAALMPELSSPEPAIAHEQRDGCLGAFSCACARLANPSLASGWVVPGLEEDEP